jgi:hypothetical protein
MKAAPAENTDSGLYPCNSNIFRPHKFLVLEKDSEQASVEIPKELQPCTSYDQVNINLVKALDISPLPIFCEKCQKINL